MNMTADLKTPDLRTLDERFALLNGALWDLDNTLYRLDGALEKTFNMAIARAALEWGVDMTLEDAIALAEQSYQRHRYSGLEFMMRFNIPNADMHHLTDKHLDHTVVVKCDETRDLFARAGHAAHALITHSARPWALNVLRRLELTPYFPDKQVFAFENYDFQSKAHSRKPFEMALSSINRNPGDVMMVEDTIENLRIPHEMGMVTVYLHHGRPVEDLPDFVTHHTANARDLLQTVYR
jgi:putative hydrolase of the HAD superfamily